MNSSEEEKRLKQRALLEDAIIIYKLDCRCGGKHETFIPEEHKNEAYDPYSLIEEFVFPASRKS
jgi:hypothetical protein